MSRTPRGSEELLSNAAGGRRAILLAHFFELDGNPLQRNKHGLLSNLLLQALEEDPEQHYPAHGPVSSFRKKEEASDWSEAELEKALFSVLNSLSMKFYVFIDGLDEICPTTGAHDLLAFLGELRPISGCKICVSSRPEQTFVRALSSYPHLKLHLLTWTDIERLAVDKFENLRDQEIGTSQDPYRSFNHFIRTFVGKAEGVFLWAHLASQSLLRGLSNGDTWATLVERLENFPSDLNKLYQGMWSRLGDDRDLYARKAAFFLNFTLVAEDLSGHPCAYFACTAEEERGVNIAWHQSKGAGTLFDLTLAAKEVDLAEIMPTPLAEAYWIPNTS